MVWKYYRRCKKLGNKQPLKSCILSSCPARFMIEISYILSLCLTKPPYNTVVEVCFQTCRKSWIYFCQQLETEAYSLQTLRFIT